MNVLPATKLSMLDLVAVREGGTVAEALAIARRTAQHVESLSFTRYWLAEYHNMPGIARSATAVLVGYLAAATSRIRGGRNDCFINISAVARCPKLSFL